MHESMYVCKYLPLIHAILTTNLISSETNWYQIIQHTHTRLQYIYFLSTGKLLVGFLHSPANAQVMKLFHQGRTDQCQNGLTSLSQTHETIHPFKSKPKDYYMQRNCKPVLKKIHIIAHREYLQWCNCKIVLKYHQSLTRSQWLALGETLNLQETLNKHRNICNHFMHHHR